MDERFFPVIPSSCSTCSPRSTKPSSPTTAAWGGVRCQDDASTAARTLETQKKALYRRRNEIERFGRRLKGFRRIFSRFDKLDLVFIAFIYFALIVEALRQ